MRSSNGRGPSPLKPVGPNDDPMSYCPKHELKFNPYKTGSCPKCEP